MTDAWMETAVERLARKLGLAPGELDSDTLALLEDEVRDAAGELQLYLDWELSELEERLPGKVVELAALYYRQDRLTEGGLTERSYSEGQVSEQERYRTPEQFQAAAAELLQSLARYRRVTC